LYIFIPGYQSEVLKSFYDSQHVDDNNLFGLTDYG